MRRLALGVGLMTVAAAPAEASVPPMDLTCGEIAVSVGMPAASVDLSLGRLVIGGAATAFAVPGIAVPGVPASSLVAGYGFAGHLGWRLSGLPGREACFGLALLGGAGSLSAYRMSGEAWFAQPALAVAVPLGAGVTLRAAGGPVFFVSNAVSAGASSENRGILPFVPNLELAFQLAPGHDLVVGGLPNIVGWRGTF